jgi:hypothetical protein
VRAAIDLDYIPSLAAYRIASSANDNAALDVILDRGGSGPFAAALQEWVYAILGKVGETAGLAVLRSYFNGDALTEFVRRPPRVQLEAMEKLLAHAPKHPTLSLAPALLDQLVVATAAFEKATAQAEGNLDDRGEAVKVFAAATTEFDGAYGLLVRVVRRKTPAALADLPVFTRSSAEPPADDDADLEDAADDTAPPPADDSAEPVADTAPADGAEDDASG